MIQGAESKILITGTVGSGKTTTIATISDIKPLSTEARNSDGDVAKALTTVGLDYGEIALEGGEILRIYGTPGQPRYSFMWKILVRGALGLIILVDNSRPDPLADLEIYLAGFSEFISNSPYVIGIGRMETHHFPTIDQYVERMDLHGAKAPVISVDVRDREQVLQLLDLLIVQMEVD